MVNQTSPRPSSIAGSVTPNARPSQASTTSAQNILIFQPDQLADLLRGHTSSSHAVLGLDMRSFQQYSEHRIIDSVNVSIPTTLLRRPAFTPVKMFGSVSSDHAKHVLKDWTSYQNIVVIDADSTIANDASPLKLLASKLLLHANTNTKIGWLMGGYAAFAEMHPDLCDASPPPAGSGGIAPAANEATKGMCLSDLAAHLFFISDFEVIHLLITSAFILGPLTAPSALGALGAGRPTLLQPTYAAHTSVASLSQNDTLIGAVDIEDRELLPRFLKDLLESGNVRAQIESNFTAVEAAEKKRLDCSFRARSRTDPFSVSDALEGGATRNRYNNIWPFNHNRVKLSCKKLLANPLLPTVTSPAAGLATPKACTAEQQMMSNDYINASHIISPAGHRRYIATQGPIASTFDDFWRMAWQEKSRIVLMLVADADVQQGSQTCHKYWPSEGLSQAFGRVRVSHIRERQVPFEAERDPDAGGGVILREFVVVVDGDESQARSIWQVQYLGWPDHGVPKHADEMLQVHHLVSKLCARLDHAYGKEDVGPVIVHCSAGCGRTGAFICIDAVLSALHSLGAIPSVSSPHDMILAAVHHLRSQRVLMVQSLSQFAFCYEVVARYCAVAGVPSSKSSKSAGTMQDTTASAFVLPLAAQSPSELDQSDYGETMQRYNRVVGADAVDATLGAFPNIAHPPDLEQTSDDDDETEARKRERAVSLEEMVVQQRTSRTRC
ncbi:protein-tyrosine phosphatase-like protein [Powellomyces hirtus]|nr:protein-tyrosine phosphatase-like protein [Powellomyces hirtus]